MLLTVILVSKVSLEFKNDNTCMPIDYPNSPQVQSTVVKSNKNNVTVILEWMQEAGVSYNVSVVPTPLESKLNGTGSYLNILYNTSYHVTIVATLCENNMNIMDFDITHDRPGVFDDICYRHSINIYNDMIVHQYNNYSIIITL